MAADPPTCAQCGTTLPATARFCPQCGTRVGEAPIADAKPPGERRQVAILFADLSGYTRLSSALDPEEVHRLLTRFFERVDAVVVELGGTIDKHIGDAVMAVFGAPIAHGNDTERAVRAAVGIHATMAELAREFGRPLAAHVGIASGEVVAADTGSAAHRNYTMTGDAVNLAARLDELAGAGETVIADDVHRSLMHMIDAEPLGTVPIRGLDRNISAWKMRALRRADASDGRLVGRDEELHRFSAMLVEADRRHAGETVLVCADPGMGKTRLATAFLAAAVDNGFRQHAGTVLDFGAAQGRDAVYAIFCSLSGTHTDASVDERRAALARALEEGLVSDDDEPFAADLLAVPQRTQALYEAMDNEARTQGRLRALVVLVERACARQPRVLLVEDVHWASPWVFMCVREIAQHAQRIRCVLVLTSRREGRALEAGWPAPEVHRFDLAPLATAAALALARTFLAANPEVALRCVERAQGNPLFLMQLLRSGADGTAIPGSIQSVVLARLDGLPPADKIALQAAAVIGQVFELELLRHLVQSPGYEITTLVARDLVRRETGDGTGWMFGHALIRDGAYASLLHSARRALHLHAADWFEDRDATLCALHLDRGDDPRAPAAYLRAARGEAAALRIDAALRLLRRGAELEAPVSVRHALASLEGNLCGDLGDAPAAIRAFERALPLAADNAERCAAWIGIAAGYRVTSTVAPALAALDRAEELATRDGLDRERSRIHYLRGNLHFAQGHGKACEAEHARALEFAQRAGDLECEAQALSGLGDAHYAQGKMRSAHAAFAGCVAICERQGLARFAIMNEAMLAIIDTWMGPGDAALERLGRARAVARELRHQLAEAMNEEVTGWMLVAHGEYDEAEGHLARGLELSRNIGARRYETMCFMLLARVAWQRNDRATAQERLRAAWAGSEQTSHGFIGAAVQGAMALMAEDPGERQTALLRGEALLREGSIAHCHIWFNRDAIAASLSCGDWSAAERYAAALEDFTRPEPLPWTDFQVAVARALAAAGRGRADRAALLECRAVAEALKDRAFVPAIDAALANA